MAAEKDFETDLADMEADPATEEHDTTEGPPVDADDQYPEEADAQ